MGSSELRLTAKRRWSVGEENIPAAKNIVALKRDHASFLNASDRREVKSGREVPSLFVEDLYRKHWKDLCGWLYRRYGPGPPEPEDIAQAAFEKMAAIKDVGRIKNPRAYLFTTAVNEALMSIRWAARNRQFIDDELKYVGRKVEELSPERIYSSQDRLNAVLHEIDRLPEKQRHIILCSRFRGMTYEEIGAATGWSIADISRQLKAALATIRVALEDCSKDTSKT